MVEVGIVKLIDAKSVYIKIFFLVTPMFHYFQFGESKVFYIYANLRIQKIGNSSANIVS